ncbi:MAG: PEP-CTERM system histidine kinase PrsK [Gammaproteobacteria bacterium]|nr:PEP-CTERM system histidine kinase PrsK [Gammaproteobacteria bacterium]
MLDFAAISAYLGAVCFGILTLLLLAGHRGARFGGVLILASLMSTAWLGAQGTYHAAGSNVPLNLAGIQLLELLRDLAWCSVFGALLLANGNPLYRRRLIVALAAVGALGCAVLVALAPWLWQWGAVTSLDVQRRFLLGGFMALALCGIVLIEQLIRNTHPDARWSIKHLCLGGAAIFAYDFLLYADALLFNGVNADMSIARGAINAVTVPMIALAAARNRQWQLNLFVSRTVMFHTTAISGAGLYLLLMAGAGYYFKAYGGSWGGVLRTVFFFAAIVGLVVLISSNQLRSRLRVFLAKHFYRNKYDYGEVWLSFTGALSRVGADPKELRETTLTAIADIMDSTGGLMWQKDATENFALVARWQMDAPNHELIPGDSPLARRLANDDYLIDLQAEAARANAENPSDIPAWLLQMPRVWLVVPIVHGDELLAFLVLAESRSNTEITWEDRDLLRTVGRQAASYLALLRATAELTDARQFEAFNRLSAFLVHDLKNVVAQLSLVIRNAERHRTNPDFIEDAFNTIGDAVTKMNRMLGSLRQNQPGTDDAHAFDIGGLLQEAVARQSARRPLPCLAMKCGPARIRAQHDRLLAVVEHLLQNAQDATPDDGTITVEMDRAADSVLIDISDTGCGMDEDFIQNRLFRPFDTTKGKAGMGIGVYESLHVISALGGRLTVTSRPGAGTTFRISLPLESAADNEQAPRSATG